VDWNSKVRFKFRTDGWWTTIANFPTEVDALGNVNNITFTPEKPAAKTNGVIPIKEVIEAREITPAVPEAPAAVPEVSIWLSSWIPMARISETLFSPHPKLRPWKSPIQ
jgi:hypothetical protein